MTQKKSFSYWLKKNKYYHQLIARFYQFMIPAGERVLHVGCHNGYLLNALKPSVGVGVDVDPGDIVDARQHYSHITFYESSADALGRVVPQQEFDYIILSGITMQVYDVQTLFEVLKHYSHSGTRIIIDSYRSLWEPTLWLLQKLGLKRPEVLSNWLSVYDIKAFLHLAGFETVTTGRQILLPTYVPIISWLCNSFLAVVPGLNLLCLNQWTLARSAPIPQDATDVSVTVVIPCRNERGNIEAAVKRCPRMGKHTEIIFVEGNSADNTLEEIHRVKSLYAEYDIKVFVQDGKGKGDAVRKGFAHATGDVLMILDADLTTPPEELPKFFDAYVRGTGEFINGSRLVYGMEAQAMRFLNLIANYCFGLGFSWLLGQRIKDTLCGTKVLSRKHYERIAAHRYYFGDFDPFGDFDLLFGAAKQNLKIIDMPVHYKNREYGTTQISRFRHGVLLIRMWFFALFKLKFKVHAKQLSDHRTRILVAGKPDMSHIGVAPKASRTQQKHN